MEFGTKLQRGRIVDFYKRLILDVELDDGSVVPVFCPEGDGGKSLYAEGAEVFVARNRDVRRKLRYECQLLNRGEGLIMVNPHYNTDLFLEAYDAEILQDFKDYTVIRKLSEEDGLRHIHFELGDNDGHKLYLTLSSIYNKQGPYVVFPTFLNFFDIETMEEMRRLRARGHRTAFVLIAPRMDCTEAKFAWNINPIAAAKVFEEAKSGLEFFCYGCKIDKKSVTIANKMKINYQS